ncbi:glycosyltransferase family 4 protein [Pontimicrobium aquaticum]|uniref:Glycosyltransferase family 4 protein n=1 Tax=Pontimicrobium aquaticum TaxID=2565367 RepID=A0A4U0ERY1_9FLAO|nr:glycosyltransferase family 4 protein [Pontimicrobium aquaticum]TJY33964.1 glycosyltransferase family 4 protein [Pontimicrobium aquaticum]
MRKKALIITYYWPPAGGPGVQRWLKFVKYLREFDVEPIVYVPENPNYPLIDQSLVNEIPKDITIIKQSISEPYKLASKVSRKSSETISKGIIKKSKNQSVTDKLLLFIRGNFFIPDARKKWVKPSVNYLSTYIRDYSIDTIITTGPPHSLHLIGMKLKQKLNLKWIADFRDPWTTIGYHKKLRLLPMAKSRHKKLEQLVLQNADRITVTSPTTKREFETITHKPITVITNGYDVNSVSNVELDAKFSLSHIGSLLSERNPKVLWKAIHDIVRDDKIFQSHLQINFVGAVSEEVLASIDKYNLSQFVNIVGYVPHEEAIRYQKKSQVLLLIEINSDDTKCIIPGKLFEYMVSNRPILAIGPKNSDVEGVIKQTNTGAYYSYLEYEEVKSKLLEYFEAFRKHNLQSHAIGLQQYSRKSLTKKLAALIS